MQPRTYHNDNRLHKVSQVGVVRMYISISETRLEGKDSPLVATLAVQLSESDLADLITRKFVELPVVNPETGEVVYRYLVTMKRVSEAY